MKQILYWFLGNTAASTLNVVWRWFWGRAIASGNMLTLEAAGESLQSMQHSVNKLIESVAQVAAVHTQAQNKLLQHQLELGRANDQAALALKDGNEEAARLAIAKALTMEKVLPNLAYMADQSQQLLDLAKQDLQIEREKLETCRFEMGNLRAVAEMNEALGQVMKLSGNFSSDSARSRFESAEAAIKNKNLKVMAQRELSQSPTQALEKQLDDLTQSDAIEQRLETIKRQLSAPN
jgi:phage shock protein A